MEQQQQAVSLLQATLSAVNGPNDLVVWHEEQVVGLRELRVAAAIFSQHRSLLDVTFIEKMLGESCEISLLMLAIRFGHGEIAAELEQQGIPPIVHGGAAEFADLFPPLRHCIEKVQPDENDMAPDYETGASWRKRFPHAVRHPDKDGNVCYKVHASLQRGPWQPGDAWGTSCLASPVNYYDLETGRQIRNRSAFLGSKAPCWGWPEDVGEWMLDCWQPVHQAREAVDLPITHMILAAFTEKRQHQLLLGLEPGVRLLDSAILLGYVEAATEIAHRCASMRPLRIWESRDLIEDDPVGLRCPSTVLAASVVGADFSRIALRQKLPHSGHAALCDFTLLDAAILGAHSEVALELKKTCTSRLASSSDGFAFLNITWTDTPEMSIKSDALKVAAESGIDLTAFKVDLSLLWHDFLEEVACERSCSACNQLISRAVDDQLISRAVWPDLLTPPGSAASDHLQCSLTLLDVAILLRQPDVVYTLAAQSVDTRLSEDFLDGVLERRKCQYCEHQYDMSLATSAETYAPDCAHKALCCARTRYDKLIFQWSRDREIPSCVRDLILAFTTKWMAWESVQAKGSRAIAVDQVNGMNGTVGYCLECQSCPAESIAEGEGEASHVTPDSTGPAAGNMQDSKEDEAADEMGRVFELSLQEGIQQDNTNLAEALLRSKTDAAPLSQDDVVVLRMTRCSLEATHALLNSTRLAECHERVRAAGCEVMPSWAAGAKLLVPLDQKMLAEAGLDLKPHNIISLRSDIPTILASLREVAKQKRPKLRPEHQAEFSNRACAADQPDAASSTNMFERDPEHDVFTADGIDIEIQNTFVHFSPPRQGVDSSTVVQSAPAGDSSHAQPENPRQWA